jgi:2-methylcitrate dehydratase PrpD
LASTGLPLVADGPDAKRRPRDPVEAQFSIYYSAAVALATGAAGPAQYRAPWLGDPDVLALAGRVEAGSSPESDALFPEKWAARVRVHLNGGNGSAPLETFVEDCLGDPAKPLTGPLLMDKIRVITEGCLDDDARESIAAEVARLDQSPSVDPLMDLLVRHFRPPASE